MGFSRYLGIAAFLALACSSPKNTSTTSTIPQPTPTQSSQSVSREVIERLDRQVRGLVGKNDSLRRVSDSLERECRNLAAESRALGGVENEYMEGLLATIKAYQERFGDLPIIDKSPGSNQTHSSQPVQLGQRQPIGTSALTYQDNSSFGEFGMGTYVRARELDLEFAVNNFTIHTIYSTTEPREEVKVLAVEFFVRSNEVNSIQIGSKSFALYDGYNEKRRYPALTPNMKLEDVFGGSGFYDAFVSLIEQYRARGFFTDQTINICRGNRSTSFVSYWAFNAAKEVGRSTEPICKFSPCFAGQLSLALEHDMVYSLRSSVVINP